MPTALHSKQATIDGIHTPIAYVYANAAARTGASGFTVEDLGKFAWQSDDNTVWMLVSIAPIWIEITASGATGSANKIQVLVEKGSPGTILKGQAVKVVGFNVGTGRPTVELANATTLANGPCSGVANGTITDAVPDNLMIVGQMTGLDTTVIVGAIVGFGIYLDIVDGGLVGTAPQGPAFVQALGVFIYNHASDGVLGVNVLSLRANSNTAPSPVGIAAPGTSDFGSRRDHVHAHGNQGGGSEHALVIAAGAAGFMSGADKTALDNAATLTATQPVNVTKAAAAVGVAVTAARADHKHDVTTAAAGTITVGAAAAEGAATSLARSDHTHALTAPAAPANVTKAAAAAGVATTVARSDHKHDITTAAPVTVGTANTEGASTSLARADHVHSHGNQAGGALHADVIAAGASGFMTGADKTKLDGLSPTGSIFGSGAQDFINAIPFNTNSAIDVVAASFTTASNPAGRYRIALKWSYTATTISSSSRFKLFVDGVQQEFTAEIESKDTTDDTVWTQWTYMTFGAPGTRLIELRVNVEGGSFVLTVNRTRAEIWRVS